MKRLLTPLLLACVLAVLCFGACNATTAPAL